MRRLPTVNCRGQAMTELTVASAWILVPLFLLIPLLGKYIDLRHTAIQAARYATWERSSTSARATPSAPPPSSKKD